MSCRLLKNYNTIWLIFWKWLVFCYRIKLKNKHVLRKDRKDKKISRSIESNEIFRKNDRISDRSLSKTVRITFLIAGVQSQSRFFPTTFPFPILSFLFFFLPNKKIRMTMKYRSPIMLLHHRHEIVQPTAVVVAILLINYVISILCTYVYIYIYIY